jgi:hypothetical protein
MATGGEVIVNSLPTAPSLITINPEIAPSTGGMIDFQVSYDKTSEQGQNNKIAYSSSLNGEKIIIEGSSVRLEVRRQEQIKDGTTPIGNKVGIKVVKNKVAPPFRTCEVDMIYGLGISKYGEVLDLAVEKGIVNKSGAWYSYEGNKLDQGKEKTVKIFKENNELFEEIYDKVRKAYDLE